MNGMPRSYEEWFERERKIESEKSYERMVKMHQLPPKERIVAQLPKVNPKFTLKQLSQRLGVNYNTLRRELPELVRKGIIYRVSRGRYSG